MELDNQKETYLAVMIASLENKKALLEQLITLTREQEALIRGESIEEEPFNRNLEEKEKRILKIREFDQGFEKLYQAVKEELEGNKDKYREKIQRLKELITGITDQSVQLQVLERQNKARMEVYFSNKKRELRNLKKSNQTVLNYYKNMTDHQEQQSYFFDKKK